MSTQQTDEISSGVPIPRAEQEERVPRATRKLIDIHIYDLPEEETYSIEGTGYTVEADQSKPDDQQQREHLHPQQPRKGPPWFLVLIALLVLVLIAGSLAYVPFFQTATITIVPVSRHLSATSSMTIVTGQANAAQNQIQGRSLPQMTMSQTQRQATTGITTQQARPGRGTITFYHAALSQQSIAAGMLLMGADGIQVATDQSVTVPAAQYPTFGTASVPAHAVQPGPAGNIRAGDIYGSCCLLNISAENHTFTEGEADRTYQSVAPQDIDNTVASLKSRLTQAVTAALQTQVEATETLVIPLSCEQHSTTDHEIGEKATQVEVTVTQTCMGVTYQTAFFQQLIRQMQTQTASKEQQESYKLSGEVQTTLQTVTLGSTEGTETLTVQSRGTWVSQFSKEQLGHLAKTIAGKRKQQAMPFLLHTQGVQQVSMSLSGETLPSDPQNIRFLLVGQL